MLIMAIINPLDWINTFRGEVRQLLMVSSECTYIDKLFVLLLWSFTSEMLYKCLHCNDYEPAL